MTVKKKTQAPSKVKYDAEHPVISFRLDLGLKEKLEGYIRDKGISYADFVKEALNVKEARDAEIIEITYDTGYEAGLKEGEERNEEIQKLMLEFQNLYYEKRDYCAKIEYANQAYATRNRELEAQLATVQKNFSALDFNDLRLIGDLALKAQIIKVRDSLNLRDMALKAQLIKATESVWKH